MTHRVAFPRPEGHPARAISIVLSRASHRERPLRTKLCPCPSPGHCCPEAVPTPLWAGDSRGPVVGEAVLPLRVDWWKDGFAVDLKSSPQGLPDLLRVCNNTTKLPGAPLGSQHPQPCPWKLDLQARWGKAPVKAS